MTGEPLPRTDLILYQTEDGRTRIQCRLEDETIWLAQALIADLFQKGVRTVNEHLANVFEEGELHRETTIRKFRIVRQEGDRQVADSELAEEATCKGYLQVRSEGGQATIRRFRIVRTPIREPVTAGRIRLA